MTRTSLWTVNTASVRNRNMHSALSTCRWVTCSPMSEEQKELADREKALQDEYRLLAAEAYDSYEATAEVMAAMNTSR